MILNFKFLHKIADKTVYFFSDTNCMCKLLLVSISVARLFFVVFFEFVLCILFSFLLLDFDLQKKSRSVMRIKLLKQICKNWHSFLKISEAAFKFRLAWSSPHCRFDGDICATALLVTEGVPSGKQRPANRSITPPLCPQQ